MAINTVGELVWRLKAYRPELKPIVLSHAHNGKNGFDIRDVEIASSGDDQKVVLVAFSPVQDEKPANPPECNAHVVAPTGTQGIDRHLYCQKDQGHDGPHRCIYDFGRRIFEWMDSTNLRNR